MDGQLVELVMAALSAILAAVISFGLLAKKRRKSRAEGADLAPAMPAPEPVAPEPEPEPAAAAPKFMMFQPMAGVSLAARSRAIDRDLIIVMVPAVTTFALLATLIYLVIVNDGNPDYVLPGAVEDSVRLAFGYWFGLGAGKSSAG